MIAAQEKLHPEQAAKLLAAIGAAMQLRQPSSPQSRGFYLTGLPRRLLGQPQPDDH